MANRIIKVSKELIESILRDGTGMAFESDMPSDVTLVGVLAYPNAQPDVVTLIVGSAEWPLLPADAKQVDMEITPTFKARL